MQFIACKSTQTNTLTTVFQHQYQEEPHLKKFIHHTKLDSRDRRRISRYHSTCKHMILLPSGWVVFQLCVCKVREICEEKEKEIALCPAHPERKHPGQNECSTLEKAPSANRWAELGASEKKTKGNPYLSSSDCASCLVCLQAQARTCSKDSIIFPREVP